MQQESAVNQRDAERVGPSWYLCRDGQQIGPLTDRELSLFAKGGNFKPGDLLWTAGLDGWKSAEDVFGLKTAAKADEASSQADDASFEVDDDTSFEIDGASFEISDEPDGESSAQLQEAEPEVAEDASASIQLSGDPEIAALEFAASSPDIAAEGIAHDPHDHDVIEPHADDVSALVQALKGEAPPADLSVKERVVHELKAFAGAFIYLWVVFTVLLLHEWLVLADHHIGFAFYGLATLNAIGVGKVMVVAEHFRFAEQLKEKPLIYPIAYKTVAFTTLLLAAYALEVMLIGWIGGRGFLASAPAYGGIIGTLSLWLIFCVALMPYFAFKELERAVGPDMIRKLMLGRR
jgi:uncharacterized protein DUF4339